MATNGRRIGKDAELEGAGRLNRLFGTAFRRSQQHKGATDAPDLIDEDHPEIAVEVKRRKSMNVREALDKARDEAAEEATALLIHRKPGERWLLTVDLFEAPEAIIKLAEILFDRLPSHWEDGGVFEALMKNALAMRGIVESEGIDGRRIERQERRADS